MTRQPWDETAALVVCVAGRGGDVARGSNRWQGGGGKAVMAAAVAAYVMTEDF